MSTSRKPGVSGLDGVALAPNGTLARVSPSVPGPLGCETQRLNARASTCCDDDSTNVEDRVIAALPAGGRPFSHGGAILRFVRARDWSILPNRTSYSILNVGTAEATLHSLLAENPSIRLPSKLIAQTLSLLAASPTARGGRGILLLRSRPAVAHRAAPSPPAPPARKRRQETTFIEVLLVRDSDGYPIRNHRLILTDPDGNQEYQNTNARGRFRVDGLSPGSCGLSAKLPAHMRLGTTGTVVDVGSTAPNTPPDVQAITLAALADVEEHQVMTGETLESLASDAGLAWRQLAIFNWGTDVPQQISNRLRDYVGCTKKTRDGHNYQFDDSDHPGIVYVPRPWSVAGLSTGTLHVVAVRVLTGFRVIAETQHATRLPHVAAKVKFANGQEKNVTLGIGGVALVKDPPPGPVEVTYTDAEDLKTKTLAAEARAAFDSRSAEEIYRVLKHSPPMVRKLIGVYDQYFNTLHGKGFVRDLYAEFVEKKALNCVVGLLAKAGVPTDEGAVFVAAGKSGGSHFIFAAPELRTVVPRSKVTYTCAQRMTTIGPPTDGTEYAWYCLNDRRSVARDLFTPQVYFGPQKGMWEEASWGSVGDHTIVCRVQNHNSTGPVGPPYYYEYPQAVENIESVTARNLGKITDAELRDPQQALSSVFRLLRAWQAAEDYAKAQHFPAPSNAEQDDYDRLKKSYRLFYTKLNERVGGEYINVKHFPARAAHVEIETSKSTVLQVCLRPGDKDNSTADASPSQRASQGSKKWDLVDWTNPSIRQLTGVYGGSGTTPEEAIRDAFATWDYGANGNSYPEGLIQYAVPSSLLGTHIDGRFETSGLNWLGKVSSFFGYVGAVAGILALVLAPIPGSSLAAGALYVAVFASTTSAVINIAQRYHEGFSNGIEDGLDALTIVSNCLGMAWMRGASISMAGKTWILVGRVGADAAQGIMLVDEYYERYDAIMNNPRLGPEQRTKQLLLLLGGVAATGAMMYINFKGTKADVQHLGSGKRQVNIKDLGDKNAKLKVEDRLPDLEGHTDQEIKLTKITTEEARAPVTEPNHIPTFEEEFPDEKFWIHREVHQPDHILLEHADPGSAWTWKFEAEWKNGTVEITVRTAQYDSNGKFVRGSSKPDGSPCMKAGKLYQMMFKHFERHGLPVKRWGGQLAWDNADRVVAWIDAHPTSPQKEGVFAAETWRFWKQWSESKNLQPVIENFHLDRLGGSRLPGSAQSIGPLIDFSVRFDPK